MFEVYLNPEKLEEKKHEHLKIIDKDIEKLDDDVSSHAQGMDKWIMGTNAATLALSTGIIFTTKYNIYSSEIGWMFACWIILGVSFVCSLTTYLLVVEKSMLGIKANKVRRWSISSFFGTGLETSWEDEHVKTFNQYGPKIDNLINILNRIAYVACVIGVICLVMFLIRSTLEMREVRLTGESVKTYIIPVN